jgi:sec-independent protein translocase protein TatB
MLDVGFSEILLTSAIALIVLGPEKLPKVARQVGNWMGRARAMARQLSEQLEREVSAEELMKTNKSSERPNPTPMTSDPAPYDTSRMPLPPADPPPTSTAFSSAPNSAPSGADWHPAPPESKSGNG